VFGQGSVRRRHSLANANAESWPEQLELHIRTEPGGAMTDWFGTARVNALLRLNAPLGIFFFRTIDGLDLVYLATGPASLQRTQR
jgi:NAD(P)H-flavin reductase